MKYFVEIYETGDVVDEVDSLEKGIEMIRGFAKEDEEIRKENEWYEPGNYAVYSEDRNEFWTP